MQFNINCPPHKLSSCYAAINRFLLERLRRGNEVFGRTLTENTGGDVFLVDHQPDEISIDLISRREALRISRLWREQREAYY